MMRGSMLLLLLICSKLAWPVTKVACIGASITYGATLADRVHQSYPARLQALLGEAYDVGNFGVSGTTLLSHGNLPYRNTEAFQKALKSQPQVVFIDLGGNDSKLINRKYLSEFKTDYHQLIGDFRYLPSHPRIILLLPVVSFVQDTTGIWDPVIRKIIRLTQDVAYEEQVEILDMHSLLIDRPELLPDQIHPNDRGSAIMANRLYEQLNFQQDTAYHLLTKLGQFSPRVSSFYGYKCADFLFRGRSCKVVEPKFASANHLWIWRARFWGHEPQTDIALLERGFHLVYCDVAELFGNAEAVDIWNGFYRVLRKGGLADQAVMEGMSRGAVYVFNWAAVNYKKVACVYVDNPLLDLKMWPVGLGKFSPSDEELRIFKDDYKLSTKQEIEGFSGSPIDKVPEIVKGHFPILILNADDDDALDPQANALLFEKKVKALNGDITVIHKPGFKHHPHSLPNPALIVGFILNATRLTK